MGSSYVEKTEDELRKEIDELYRQQREINERLRDPRGLRRGAAASGPRNFAANGARQRGFIRPAERNDVEDQPPAKRRLSSAVVKIEEGEIEDDEAPKTVNLAQQNDVDVELGEIENAANTNQGDRKPSNWLRRDANQRPSRVDFDIPVENVPRVLPKDEDPKLVSRNKRMLGQLLGTLERFRKEDVQLSGSQAYMRRSDSLRRAEERAREESEKLRQQEREQIAEKRKRDLTLRARIAAKAEEKKLELLFLRWSEHHKKLGNFLRTKAEPPIYYMFAKPLDKDILPEEQKEQLFEDWKAARREELSQYQKQIAEQYVANVDKDLERLQNGRKGRRGPNGDVANLQETMDKELETHQLEHGPKSRIIPGQTNNEDDYEDDVEDINVAEDDMIDDVLGVDDNGRTVEEAVKLETGNGSPDEDKKDE